jgi:DNA-binding protein HU-beta
MAVAKKSMTKAQLVALLADNVGITKKESAAALELLAQTACSESKLGFTIPGIGKLIQSRRKARMGRNPKTGEAIKIPAKQVLKFRISKICKDVVLPKK